MRWFTILPLILWASFAHAATLTVCPVGCTHPSLQAAINAAQYGDTITLSVGTTYTGQFLLPFKTGTGVIRITRAASVVLLPSPGMRVLPAHEANLPKICSDQTGPVFAYDLAAHHYEISLVKICSTHTSTTSTHDTLVNTGSTFNNLPHATTRAQLPHHLVFDQVLFSGTPTGNVRRGLKLQTGAATVTNSYFEDFHEIGADSQAIWSSSGEGPFLIDNNHLEAAGENAMFGGADPPIPGLVVGDAAGVDGNRITRNFVTKPRTWWSKCVTGTEAGCGGQVYAGRRWQVKNALEFKNGRNWLVQGNIFEYSWSQGDQAGNLVVLNPINQDGACTWCTVDHITIRDNIFRFGGFLGIFTASGLQNPGNDYAFVNNLVYGISRAMFQGQTYVMLLSKGIANFKISHNTIDYEIPASDGTWLYLDGTPDLSNFVLNDNLTKQAAYGIFGDGGSTGQGALDAYATASYIALKNSFARDTAGGITYPATTVTPTLAAYAACFTNPSAGDYRLTVGCVLKNAASDGTDVGVDMRRLPDPAGDGSTLFGGGIAPGPVPVPIPVPVPLPIPSPTPTPTPIPTPVPVPVPTPGPGLNPPTACPYTVTVSTQSFTSSGGTASVTIDTLPGCRWTVTDEATWVSVSPSSGTGPRTLTLTVTGFSGIGPASRLTYVVVAGKQFPVRQERP